MKGQKMNEKISVERTALMDSIKVLGESAASSIEWICGRYPKLVEELEAWKAFATHEHATTCACCGLDEKCVEAAFMVFTNG
jgi:hypothetical protein